MIAFPYKFVFLDYFRLLNVKLTLPQIWVFFREEIDLLVFHSAFLDSVKIFWTQLDIGAVLVSSAGHLTSRTVKTMFTNLLVVIFIVCHLFGSVHLVCFKSPVLLPQRNVTATKVLSFQPLHEVTANQIFKQQCAS